MSARETIQAWLAPRRAEMETLLATLVDTDSGSYDKAGVDAVGEAILAFLGEDGIAVERSAVPDFGDVLRAHIPGAREDAPALLLGHRDTVFPTGTARARPFSKRGDIGFGPGVADMKAGLVVTCFLLRAFARASEPPPVPIVALFTGDEEIGSGTGRAFIEAEARRARAVFNLEPGRANGNVVTARKGGMSMTIEARGKAAHAGVNHADGASAIDCLARKIVRLHGLTDYASGITANVGLVKGGVSTNTVAPHASAGFDMRYTTLDQVEPLVAAVAAIVAAEDGAGTSAAYRMEHGFPPMEARWSAELMARYRAEAARLGFAVEGEFTGGCSDAGFTASLGVPTLCGLGPVGGKAHTEDEFCELDTLVPRAQALAGAILSLTEG